MLTNDTDVDTGDSKTVSAVNGAAAMSAPPVTGTYGSVTIDGDGSYTYTLDNADADTNALAQGADRHATCSPTRSTDANGATSIDHADHHHHRHQRRAGGGRRHQCGDAVSEAGVNPAQHAVRRRHAGDRQRADQRHRRRHWRHAKTVAAVNGAAAMSARPVAGTYGSVTIDSDGSYTYTLDNAEPTKRWPQGETVTDVSPTR